MKKFVSVITALAAVAAVSASASAYTIDKDLGFGWSATTTIPGEEFDEVTVDTTVTITYETNKALADMPGNEYWCIKLMINDEGWPFMDNLAGPELSEGKDSYTVDVESSSISFKIPAEELEHLQIAGMAIMGHGLTLKEMTFSNGTTPSTPDTPTTPSGSDAPNVNTGVEGAAAVIGAAVLAAGVVIVSRRKK